MKLPSLFSDNMVLQRDLPIPLWGWISPHERVLVELAGQTAHASAGADGRWSATLAPMQAGGPFTMTIKTSLFTRAVENILVGEVWIAAGQSNMEFPVSSAANAEEEVFSATYENIRLFTVQKSAVVESVRDVGGQWSVCDPRTVSAFSAVAYFFGRQLHRELGVPIGLINASWGGTIAEAWTSREALAALPQFNALVNDYESNLTQFEVEAAQYQAKLTENEREWYPADPGNDGYRNGWADPQTDVTEWGDIRVPSYWQSAGLDFSGILWFRRDVDIPEVWTGKDLVLNLCPCDKHDTTYFNNVKIGEMGREQPDAWSTPRTYQIPRGLAMAGRNTLAVRVYSFAWAGGIMGSPAQLDLGPQSVADSERLRLAGKWKFKVEHNFGKIIPLDQQQPLGSGNPNSPYILFNSMIRPLIPYAIRGVIWYQGESNVPQAAQYRMLLSAMIDSWRRGWNQGDFPFLFVQLPSHLQYDDDPTESAWAELREAQLMALRTPNTAMAVTIDLGDANDIHPTNKQDVGERLVHCALHHVYGRTETPCSPLPSGFSIEGSAIRVRFSNANSGLRCRGDVLRGFALAAADRRFVWAEATIDRDSVLVRSPHVNVPAAVRYAWADNPVCNLYNDAGLPASPFRTDEWRVTDSTSAR